MTHLDRRERRCALRVGVETACVECPAGAVLIDDGVGHDVVVMGERVERTTGEMAERRDRQATHKDPFALAARCGGVHLEVGESNVVPRLDRTQDATSRVVVAEEREDPEGFLGRQREIEPDTNRGRVATFEKRDEIASGDEPLTSCAPACDDIGTFRQCARGDCLRVVLRLATQDPEIPGGDTGQTGRVGDTQ